MRERGTVREEEQEKERVKGNGDDSGSGGGVWLVMREARASGLTIKRC